MGRDSAKGSRELRSSNNVRKSRPVKRKNVFNPKTAERDESTKSTSSKKLKQNTEEDVPEDSCTEFRIINFITVFTAISSLVKCKKCNGNVKFQTASTRGLGFKIVVSCDNCVNENIPSCSFVGHSYEVNRRFIFVMRILGIGFEGMRKFCGLMDMPPFLDKNTCTILLKQILDCSKAVAESLFEKAVNTEKQETSVAENKDTNELTVSGDGTWQKRGFTCLFGVSSIIGYFTGKILDLNIKSANCKQCEYWKHKINTVEYEEWNETHQNECTANHKGSFGKTKVDAMIEMFKQSETKCGVKYSNYIGGDDSEIYTGVVKAAPYDNTSINKKECVGYNQNNNESFNQLVWKICPKTININYTIVHIAAYIAACIFNEGIHSLLIMINTLGLNCGPNSHRYAEKMDTARVKMAAKRANDNTREGRMRRTLAEELLYGPGIDDSV